MFTIKMPIRNLEVYKENIKNLFKKFINKIILFDEIIEKNIEKVAIKFFLYLSILSVIIGVIFFFKLVYLILKL